MNNLTGKLLGGKRKLPLRLVLVVPFVLQICLAVGLTGWLSFRNGQESVSELASQLQSEISDRISEKTNSYLSTPRIVNQISASEINAKRLNLDNKNDLIRHFTYMQRIFKNVNHVGLGTQTGEYLAVRRKQNRDEFELLEGDQVALGGRLLTYSLDDRGDRKKIVHTKASYDPRSRPWYQDGIVDGKPRWSRIYQYFQATTLGISHSYPINRNGILYGVLATDFDLGEISYFLRSLRIGRTGRTFLMERNGNIIANSTKENLFVIEAGKTRQIRAVESKDPLVSGTAAYLINKYGNLSQLSPFSEQLSTPTTTPSQVSACNLASQAICSRTEVKTAVFDIIGVRQFLRVTALKNDEGVDWLLVVISPEADFMDRINNNTSLTIFLCFIALMVAIAIGLLTAHWISQPILRLGKASSAIANFSTSLEVNSHPPVAESNVIVELETLANSFNQMAQQLRDSFTALKRANEELEQRVTERTAALSQANETLHRLATLDGLTQVANRRRLDEYLEQVWQESLQSPQPLAMILCDVDCFKLFNDTYGHQMGDDCLQQVAQTISLSVKRSGDLVARYGGEEFAVILPNCDLQNAVVIAERMRTAIAHLQISHISSYVKAYVTLSLGIAVVTPTKETTPQALIAKADGALYSAKARGRDRVEILE